MAKYWITKKEYINDLNHRLEYFKEEVKKLDTTKGNIYFWYLGDRYYAPKAQRLIVEMQEELNKINNDNAYKPWVEETV